MPASTAATSSTPHQVQQAAAAAAAALPQQYSLGQAARSGPALPPAWFAVAAMLAFVALLLSFDHVVRQGVQTAELRRQTAAAQSAALWRCQALRDAQTRSDCLAGVPGLAGAPATEVAAAYASF